MSYNNNRDVHVARGDSHVIKKEDDNDFNVCSCFNLGANSY